MTMRSIQEEARIANLKRLFDFVEKTFGEFNVPVAQRDRMMTALDEVLTNVVLYAYPAGQQGKVNIQLVREGNAVTAEIVDHGQPFDPMAQPSPDVTLPIEQRPVGGLGIYLARNLVNSMRYYRKDDANHLVLTISWEQTG